MARLAGLEPATTAFGGMYSIQLNYRRIILCIISYLTSALKLCFLDDLSLRRPILYPAELQARIVFYSIMILILNLFFAYDLSLGGVNSIQLNYRRFWDEF